MSAPSTARLAQMEGWLARLLQYGSWVASGAIALGLLLAMAGSGPGSRHPDLALKMPLATFGVVLFILLPAVRVLLMLVVFTRQREFRLAIAAAIVLAIILLGLAVGIRTTSAPAG